MRRALLLATALAAIGARPASAQLLVTDPLVEVNSLGSLIKDGIIVENTAASVIQLEQTVAAVAHGNLFAAASVLPQLGVGLPGNPLGGETGQNLASAFMGASNAASVLGGAASSVYQAATFYQPQGMDYRASQIIAGGQSAAAQIAFGSRMMDSTQQRSGLLQTLFSAVGGTRDVKDAADATTRVNETIATQTNHTNQLLAAQVMQQGQRQLREAQEEQAWRCSADNFVSNAHAAVASTAAGHVQLVVNSASVPCAMPSGGAQPVSFATTQDPTAVNDGTTSVNLGNNSGTGGDLMMQQAWGAAAAQNAQALGVNPDALSATCIVESGCRNVSGSGSVTGIWQMTAGTQAQAQQEALTQNPGLSVSGDRSDPATQSIAAAQYLKDAATSLQQAGVSSPSVLDTRGYYQWGAGNGVALALADPSVTMGSVLRGTSAATLAANGISASTSVGAWRQSVLSKIPNAATTPVLSV